MEHNPLRKVKVIYTKESGRPPLITTEKNLADQNKFFSAIIQEVVLVEDEMKKVPLPAPAQLSSEKGAPWGDSRPGAEPLKQVTNVARELTDAEIDRIASRIVLKLSTLKPKEKISKKKPN
jgi:hypothetical protein